MIDKKRSNLIRETPQADFALENNETDFFQYYRLNGVPLSPTSLAAESPIYRVLVPQGEQLLNISDAFCHPYQDAHPSFRSYVCNDCGETAVEKSGHLKNGKKATIPYAEKK